MLHILHWSESGQFHSVTGKGKRMRVLGVKGTLSVLKPQSSKNEVEKTDFALLCFLKLPPHIKAKEYSICEWKKLGVTKTRLPNITGQFHPSGNLGSNHILFYSSSQQR